MGGLVPRPTVHMRNRWNRFKIWLPNCILNCISCLDEDLEKCIDDFKSDISENFDLVSAYAIFYFNHS